MKFVDRILHLKRGRAAETLAASYLKKRGLNILEKNYRCRFGEIDLICRDKQYLVFVEVRLRKTENYGGAKESVDYFKQKKLLAAANHYLMTQSSCACRFDIITLDQLDMKHIDWIKNAIEG